MDKSLQAETTSVMVSSFVGSRTMSKQKVGLISKPDMDYPNEASGLFRSKHWILGGIEYPFDSL